MASAGKVSRVVWGLAGALLAGVAASNAAAAASLVVGVPTWPSARVTAHVIAKTVEERLGVETELRERGTMTILSDINKGRLHVHPEIWFPNLEAAVGRLGGDAGTLILNPHPVDANQNICVTRATADQTGITALSDLARPDMAEKFDTDGDGKGEIWIGDSTWSATNIERIRAQSYGYDQTMTLMTAAEDVAMAAVDAAAALERPIVFYCYSPHHVFDLHEIVVLEEPPFDPDRWSVVAPAESPEWLENSRAETAWDASYFHIGYAASLVDDLPEVAAFLERIELTPSDITRMSYAIEVEDLPPEQVAEIWISENQDRLAEWTR